VVTFCRLPGGGGRVSGHGTPHDARDRDTGRVHLPHGRHDQCVHHPLHWRACISRPSPSGRQRLPARAQHHGQSQRRVRRSQQPVAAAVRRISCVWRSLCLDPGSDRSGPESYNTNMVQLQLSDKPLPFPSVMDRVRTRKPIASAVSLMCAAGAGAASRVAGRRHAGGAADARAATGVRCVPSRVPPSDRSGCAACHWAAKCGGSARRTSSALTCRACGRCMQRASGYVPSACSGRALTDVPCADRSRQHGQRRLYVHRVCAEWATHALHS
jgi:hypothetical protein